MSEHRAGIAVLLGRPNVGKSTLLNKLLKFKVSIVSPRPQTTRNRIMGVYSEESLQVAFVDTPGIWRGDRGKALVSRMVREAEETLTGVDAAVLLIDPGREGDPGNNRDVLDLLAGSGVPALLAINKIDLYDKPRLLPVLQAYGEVGLFRAMVPVSARKGKGLDGLLGELRQLMPVSEPLFPQDVVTDCSERFLCSEIIREKVFRLTGEEIPYASAVEIDKFEEVDERRLVRIYARILVEKESQQKILIGAKGQKIRAIGTDARRDIERLLGTKVYLDLHVTVAPNWSRDPQAVERLGHFED